jgi:spore coat protein U-like protein
MNKTLLSTALVAAMAAVAFVPAAHAATTANMQVQITIENACDISTAPGTMDFATHASNETAAITAQQTFNVTCTPGANYTLGFSGGTSNDVAARTMVNGAQHVDYQLYKDTGRTDVWGLAGALRASGSGNGSAQAFTVYGAVPTGANLNVPAGTYTDTVVVDVTF